MSQQDARAQTTQVQLREYCILGRTNASIISFDFVLYIALASELYRLVASIDAYLPTFVREQKNICEGADKGSSFEKQLLQRRNKFKSCRAS